MARRSRNFSPIGSIERGVALCPEDRKAEGIVADLTVRENIILAMQASRGWFRHLGTQRAVRDRGPVHQAAEHRDAVGRSAGQEPERRQPAEGDPGPLAGHRPAPSDPRRTDPRHRRGHQGGHPEAGPRRWPRKASRASSSRRSWRRCCAPAIASWSCATARRSTEFAGEVDEQELMQAIAGSERHERGSRTALRAAGVSGQPAALPARRPGRSSCSSTSSRSPGSSPRDQGWPPLRQPDRHPAQQHADHDAGDRDDPRHRDRRRGPLGRRDHGDRRLGGLHPDRSADRRAQPPGDITAVVGDPTYSFAPIPVVIVASLRGCPGCGLWNGVLCLVRADPADGGHADPDDRRPGHRPAHHQLDQDHHLQ